jgi:hypothetical protein
MNAKSHHISGFAKMVRHFEFDYYVSAQRSVKFRTKVLTCIEGHCSITLNLISEA